MQGNPSPYLNSFLAVLTSLEADPAPNMAHLGPKAQKSITTPTEDGKRKNEESHTNREIRRRVENDHTTAQEKVPKHTNTYSTAIPKIKHKNVPMFKTLRKIGNKLAQVNHHHNLMIDFEKRHQAPRRLKCRVNPPAPDLPQCITWEVINANLSPDTTEVPITHWKRKKELSQDIKGIDGHIQNKTNRQKLDDNREQIENYRTIKSELTSRRQKKYRMHKPMPQK